MSTSSLNRHKVLDQGWVQLVSASVTGNQLRDIQFELFKGVLSKELAKLASATLVIKCPIFVHLYLTKFDLSILQTTHDNTLTAYKPDVSEVGAKSVEDAHTIASDIAATTEALLINPLAYQQDGCDRFISQVISPISVYTTLAISGSLEEWIKFIDKKSLPGPIEEYRLAVESLLRAEWFNIESFRG